MAPSFYEVVREGVHDKIMPVLSPILKHASSKLITILAYEARDITSFDGDDGFLAMSDICLRGVYSQDHENKFTQVCTKKAPN